MVVAGWAGRVPLLLPVAFSGTPAAFKMSRSRAWAVTTQHHRNVCHDPLPLTPQRSQGSPPAGCQASRSLGVGKGRARPNRGAGRAARHRRHPPPHTAPARQVWPGCVDEVVDMCCLRVPRAEVSSSCCTLQPSMPHLTAPGVLPMQLEAPSCCWTCLPLTPLLHRTCPCPMLPRRHGVCGQHGAGLAHVLHRRA